MTDSASKFRSWARRAWEILNRAIGILFKLGIFVLGSAAAVHQLQHWLGFSLPSFVLSEGTSILLWGVLALPAYVVAMGVIAVLFSIGLVVIWLLYLFAKHLPELVGMVVDIWRVEKNGDSK